MKQKRLLVWALLFVVLASEGYATVRGMGEDIQSIGRPVKKQSSPDQRCRVAIKAVGQYGQVIQLTRKTRLRTLPDATIKEGET